MALNEWLSQQMTHLVANPYLSKLQSTKQSLYTVRSPGKEDIISTLIIINPFINEASHGNPFFNVFFIIIFFTCFESCQSCGRWWERHKFVYVHMGRGRKEEAVKQGQRQHGKGEEQISKFSLACCCWFKKMPYLLNVFEGVIRRNH